MTDVQILSVIPEIFHSEKLWQRSWLERYNIFWLIDYFTKKFFIIPDQSCKLKNGIKPKAVPAITSNFQFNVRRILYKQSFHFICGETSEMLHYNFPDCMSILWLYMSLLSLKNLSTKRTWMWQSKLQSQVLYSPNEQP